MKINTIIFDLGGVLIDWNPEYVFRKIFVEEKEMKYFLSEVCTSDWNIQQDAGRPLAQATEILVDQFPEYEPQIRAYYGRWEEMLGGAIEGTVALLKQLHTQNSHRIYALTNWSHETFPIALERYDFLKIFEGILVSGQEKLIKPDRRIYDLILNRYQINPKEALFIDDSLKNVDGAKAVGLHAVQFISPEQLRKDLEQLGVLF